MLSQSDNYNHGDAKKKIQVNISDSPTKLKPRIKLYQAPAILIGLIVGSTIYIAPGKVLAAAGSPGLTVVMWLVGGIFATLGGLSYAELGTTFPASGERFEYLEKMYGPSVAFCYSWVYLFFFRPAANSIKCIVLGNYLLKLVFLDCPIPESAIKISAILICLLITFMNCVNVEWSNRGNTFFVTLGVITLGIFTILGFHYIGQGKSTTWRDSFEGTSSNPGDIVTAFYIAVFAYGGWNALNFILEEMKDPIRHLPIAIYITMTVVSALYILVNVAYMSVLGKEEMLESQAVAVSFGQRLFPSVIFMVPIVVCLSQISSINSAFLITSRLGFVTARKGHLPQILALISTWSLSPVTSLISQAFLVIIVIHTMSVDLIINSSMFLLCLFHAMTMFGMIYLRFKQPQINRPLKVNIVVPLVFLLMLMVSIFLTFITKPIQSLVSCALVFGTALPVYYILIHKEWKSRTLDRYSNHLLRLAQKILLAVPQEKDN